MRWIVNLKVKKSVSTWSDQVINTAYKGVVVDIRIDDCNCTISLAGNENIQDVFYLVWELLFLYDGYFYEPISYEVNGIVHDGKELIKLGYHKTDMKWSLELLGRGQRDLSTQVMEKYDRFRNEGMLVNKMTRSVVNAFYYVNSKNYEKININHRLSLLLNIADGFVINTYRDTNNVKGSYDIFFKNTVSIKKIQKGISLLGLNSEQYKYLLTEERNALDHYKYIENSISVLVFNEDSDISNYVVCYFIYVIELVTRINFLKVSGVELDNKIIDYVIDSINDWIIYENDLDIECKTDQYRKKQLLKNRGVTW